MGETTAVATMRTTATAEIDEPIVLLGEADASIVAAAEMRHHLEKFDPIENTESSWGALLAVF
jgi:hypothetical protein